MYTVRDPLNVLTTPKLWGIIFVHNMCSQVARFSPNADSTYPFQNTHSSMVSAIFLESSVVGKGSEGLVHA